MHEGTQMYVLIFFNAVTMQEKIYSYTITVLGITKEMQAYHSQAWPIFSHHSLFFLAFKY